MIPVDQTRFGDVGNCHVACVASVLEVGIADVPDFIEAHLAGRSWVKTLNDWLRGRGLWYIEVGYGQPGWHAWMPPSYHICGGPSPRGCRYGHACVGYAGAIAFDPHPDRAGLETITEYGFFLHLFEGAPQP